MKLLPLTMLASLAMLGYANEVEDQLSQDIADLPQCSFVCFRQGAKDAGCKDETDLACICNNLFDVVNHMTPCECLNCVIPYVGLHSTRFSMSYVCGNLQEHPEEVTFAGGLFAANVSTASPEATNTDYTCTLETDAPDTTYSIPTSGAKTATSAGGLASSHSTGGGHGSPSASATGGRPSLPSTSATGSGSTPPTAGAAGRVVPCIALVGAVIMASF